VSHYKGIVHSLNVNVLQPLLLNVMKSEIPKTDCVIF